MGETAAGSTPKGFDGRLSTATYDAAMGQGQRIRSGGTGLCLTISNASEQGGIISRQSESFLLGVTKSEKWRLEGRQVDVHEA